MTFADDYNLRTTNASFNGVANGIDALLGQASVATAGFSSISTNSTTLVTTGLSITITCPNQCRVIVMSTLSASSATADYIYSSVYQNGTPPSGPAGIGIDTLGSTGGLVIMIPFIHVFTPTVGSNTYTMYWGVNGSITAYSGYRRLVVMMIRTA